MPEPHQILHNVPASACPFLVLHSVPELHQGQHNVLELQQVRLILPKLHQARLNVHELPRLQHNAPKLQQVPHNVP